MKPLFSEVFKAALLAGKSLDAEINGEPFVLRIDREHGNCVCKVVGDEETPLFNVKYLEARYRTHKWQTET